MSIQLVEATLVQQIEASAAGLHRTLQRAA